MLVVGCQCPLLDLNLCTEGGEGLAVLFGFVPHDVLGCFEDLLQGFDNRLQAYMGGDGVDLAFLDAEDKASGDVGDVSLADVALGNGD